MTVKIPFEKWVVEVTNHELYEIPMHLHSHLHTAYADGVPIEDARIIHAEHRQRDRERRNAAGAAAAEPIPPYDQGFRDALLTVKARLTAILSDPTETQPLAHLEKNLNTLIDRANVDLWKLFAVAEADLSRHTEAEALRAMLRAPTGVLIDSAGRMLFVRLNGTEYDTGVLALLDEVARLKAAATAPAAPPPELMTIVVNGTNLRVESGKPLTYEMLSHITGWRGAIPYHGEGMWGKFEGTLTPGGSLVVPPNTVFRTR